MGLMFGEYIIRGEMGGDSVARRDMFQCSLLGSDSPVNEGDVWQPSAECVCLCEQKLRSHMSSLLHFAKKFTCEQLILNRIHTLLGAGSS